VTVAWLRRFSTRYSEGAVMVDMASCVIGPWPVTRYGRFQEDLADLAGRPLRRSGLTAPARL
jgi:hypothetical protein